MLEAASLTDHMVVTDVRICRITCRTRAAWYLKANPALRFQSLFNPKLITMLFSWYFAILSAIVVASGAALPVRPTFVSLVRANPILFPADCRAGTRCARQQRQPGLET